MGTAKIAEGVELSSERTAVSLRSSSPGSAWVPGARIRVVEARRGDRSRRLGGSLPRFPDLAWEDFERASELAHRDLGET
jgi:hypothetical protein